LIGWDLQAAAKAASIKRMSIQQIDASGFGKSLASGPLAPGALTHCRGAAHMSTINNISNTNPVQRIVANPIQKSLPADATKPARAADRLEFSGISHMLHALKSNNIRTDKVSTIKSQLEAGTYDADGKLDSVLDKVLDDLAK
jgi:anti-sigma28 factor (negative regulator of flagellin synthesis)